MNERIKKLRKTLDLTQQKFANCIGTTANVLTNYETGRRNPSNSVINNICKTFNVSEEWLRDGTGDMFVEMPEEDLYTKAATSLLRDNDILAIEGLKLYYGLSPEAKKAAADYILQLADRIREHSKELEDGSPSESTETATAVEEAEAAYIKSRSKNARSADISASNTTAGNSNSKNAEQATG